MYIVCIWSITPHSPDIQTLSSCRQCMVPTFSQCFSIASPLIHFGDLQLAPMPWLGPWCKSMSRWTLYYQTFMKFIVPISSNLWRISAYFSHTYSYILHGYNIHMYMYSSWRCHCFWFWAKFNTYFHFLYYYKELYKSLVSFGSSLLLTVPIS